MKSGLPYNVMRHRDWDFAPREPVTTSVALAIFGGGVATAGQLAVASFLVNLAVTAVTSWAINALTPKPDFSSADSGGIMVNAREAAAPQDFLYGQVRKGGIVTYYESTGDKNKFLHQIIALAGHEVEEVGDIYINDEPVTVDSDGFVTGDKWKSKIRVQKFDGTQTSAPADLLSESNQIGANFVGNGIAYLYVRYEFDRDVFPNGVPLITAVVKGKKVFDPRTGVTAYSNNAALCLRDYIVSEYGLDDDDIDDLVFSSAANVCDEAVSLSGGGIEPRYTMNGIIKANTNHGDVLNRMVTTCAGTLFWGAGNWKLTAGAYSAASKTLTLDDLRGPISLNTRTNLRDQFNVVQGTFNDADQRWITVDYPPIRSAAFIAQDNDVEQPLDFELPLTTSSATAQRLAKLTLLRGREQMSLSADFGLNAFDVEVGEIIALDIDRYGWSNKEFEVTGWRFGPSDEGDTRVTLTLRETSEAAFDWNAEEEDIIGNDSNLPSFADGLEIFGLTVSGGGRTQGDGTFVNSAIVSWTAVSNSFIESYEVQWKPVADSSYSSAFTTDNTLEVSPLVDGVEYIFRVRAISVLGNRGPFSTITFTGGGDETAPGLPTDITAEGGFKYITVKWTNPADTDLNFVEVWENTSNSVSGATEVGIASSNQFTRTGLGLNETRYYFLRSVDYSGNQSAFTAGVSATTTFVDDADFENGIRSLFEEQGLYPIEDVDSLPPSGILNRKVFNRADGKLYEWNGSSWVLVVSAVEAPDISGELQTNQIALDAVTSDLIANDAVQSENIANLAVNEAKISDSAITTTKIANAAVEEGKLALSAVTADKIANLAVNEAKIANSAITTTKIANAAVESGNLANDAATEAKIATSAITETKIASGAITTPKISAGAVTATEIAAGSITTSKIDAGAVTASEIAAGTITSNEIATNSITAGNIAAGAITASELSTNSVTAIKIASDSITTGKIAAGAVTAGEIAAGSITSNEIATNTITSGEIASGAITTNELAAGSVTATEIASESIISSKIAAGAVTATEIAAGSITSNEIASDTITANNIATETITADEISGNTITGDKIVANTITGGLLATSGIITNSAQINDALITNAKIENGAITNAKIDNAAITSAKIDDLAVETIKVADRAITSQVGVESSGGSTTGSSWVTVSSLSFSANGGEEVLLGASFNWVAVSFEFTETARVRLVFNGSTVRSASESLKDESKGYKPAFISSKTASFGTNSLYIQVKLDRPDKGSSSVSDATLFVLIAKK